MKKYWSTLLLLCCLLSNLWASDKKEKIEWKTFSEVEELMKKTPRKILIDVYTNWCTWCKRMDKTIYYNPQAIAYINEHYYAIKFNAETKEPISFQGETYYFNKRYKTNELALKLCNYQPSYPTTILLNEKFEDKTPFAGYLELYQMESVLKYYATNNYKKQSWNDWNRSFVFEWQNNAKKK